MPSTYSITHAPIPTTVLTELTERVAGRVLTPGYAGYREATELFNAAIDNRPGCVVEARTTADVATTVRIAREHEIDLSVKGGGHGVAGLATAGRLVIDLSTMRRVEVDPHGYRVSAQGGATWVEVDTETQRFGLATPGGRVTHTGIAGLTLGGGQGWLSPKFGLACDNLISAEVVTADGEVVTAGPDGDEELLWALRGGGGNFGVVTRFDYRLHEVGPVVLGGVLVHPFDLAPELLGRYEEVVATAGRNLGGAVVLATAPDAPIVPRDTVGQLVAVTTVAWFGDVAEGERVLAPLREFGPPTVDMVGLMPYTVLQTLTDEPNPRGMRNYWTAAYAQQLNADVVDAVIAAAEEKRSPLATIVLLQMGEAVRSVPEDATAFPHRNAQWLVHPVAMWRDSDEDDLETGWARRARSRLAPFQKGGSYLNADSSRADPAFVRAAFGEDKYARLLRVKRRLDAGNVFQHAPNITTR